MISINITGTEQLDRLEEMLRSSVLLEARNAGGEAAVTALQDHFTERNQAPNKRGWPKRGFWSEILKTVTSQSTDPEFDVLVSSPAFWRKYKGGEPIVPKTGSKKLAIPATAAAYAAGRPAAGRGPELMVVVRRRNGKPQGVGLAEFTTRESKTDPTKKVRIPGAIWYWLVDSVNPKADPNAVPDIAKVENMAQNTAYSYLQARLSRETAA
jgi:hypothetical protein